MKTKEYLINQLPQVEVDGSKNIPTVLFYQASDKVLIGNAARDAANDSAALNFDFKVDLGHCDPTSKPKGKFRTACGDWKSAVGLTGDFLREVLRHTSQWLHTNGIDRGTSVLLAEPLAMQTSPDWLANYRRNLEDILKNRSFAGIENIEFANVDFLPEPFAVYQYYRYGIRHPFVAERGKKQALVLDFGGGTLDVCIIETDKEGDIKKGGPNSKPLAASSESVGGFYVNRKIAEHLLRKYAIEPSGSGKLGKMFAKGLDVYSKWRIEEPDLSTVAPEYAHFVRHFHNLVYDVENPKLSICKTVRDWGLDVPLNIRVTVAIPQNPFTATPERTDTTLSALDVRQLFVSDIWEHRMKSVLRTTLERGQAELNGAPITVVLLSGGSANIGWLEKLLRRDFTEELSSAEILHLPDFQEVVAKGLAVECARRFYSEAGDFSSVTYNRLCLLLDSNSTGPKQCRFSPKTEEVPQCDIPGVLLPSASSLKRLIDKPIRWKVHQLSTSPKRLDYYFLRSSFDYQDTDNLQNIEHHTVFAKTDAFDHEMKVELVVRPDGTALPRFIYKTGRNDDETTYSEGKAFYLDMTYGQTAPVSKAYIGLDFGTSNTSVSFVSWHSIQVYERRSTEKTWTDLSDLALLLPYPLAAPLCDYLNQTEKDHLQRHAREFIEAALSMAAYVTYMEYCALRSHGEPAIFKGYTQRSAGPLWGLLRTCLDKLPKAADVAAPFRELISPAFYKLIDDAVTFIGQEKHEKASGSELDLLKPVQVLANISQRVFSTYIFGTFENVKRQPFSNAYQGEFREAHGTPHVIKRWAYKGSECFAEQEPYLVNIEKGIGLGLVPLLFWKHCDKHQDLERGHCYIYDKAERQAGKYSYKAVGCPCACDISRENEFSALSEALTNFRKCDPQLQIIHVGELKEM